ncbi:MAG: glycosyltransferase [Bacteroidales bacterium]|nr:glycosyltransferase [Bacteroidales bacterium]
MKRIAVVFEENVFDPKGTFRAKLERVRHLMKQGGLSVDVWCVQVRYTWIERLLLGKRSLGGVTEASLGRPETLVFDGITYHMLWLDYSIIDHFLFFKLGRRPWFYPRFLKNKASLFKGYDALSAHGFEGAFLAKTVKEQYGIPYCVSWHGSDIHTKPFRYPCIRPITAGLIAGAYMNFFVSQALLRESDEVGPGNKMVLYNGCDESFRRMPDAYRSSLRRRYCVDDDVKVVGFAGGLVAVKNASLLPEIFSRIRDLYEGPVAFWVIGDGPLGAAVKRQMEVPCRFWGNLPPELMPEVFNAMDLLVLPSRQEGLGLVLIEALRCGCKAVGSEVGGIPEVLDSRHCVAPGDGFADRFAAASVEALLSSEPQTVPEAMSWDASARMENEILLECI